VESQCRCHREYTAEITAVASLCLDKAILLIFKPLKMVFCSSCDGVPLKFKKKSGGPPVYQHGLFECSIDPCYNSLDNTFDIVTSTSHDLRDQNFTKTNFTSNNFW
jgi:hypothetical protein